MYTVKVCIMAGGAGKRFWPMSSEETPKQFLDVLGRGKTLLQMTVDRAKGITDLSNILIITQEKYRALILEQCPELSLQNLLFEPERKNTAAALAFACVYIMKEQKEAIMLVLSSDHLIDNETRFAQLAKKAIIEASINDNLYTIGILPSSPHTGYGYLEVAPAANDIHKVLRFVEKPALDKAEEYLLQGNYLWNAGIFIWRTTTFARVFKDHAPDIFEDFEQIDILDKNAVKKAFSTVRSESIDFAVMEKADNIYTIGASFGWDDLGSWGSVYALSSKNAENNSIRAQGFSGRDLHNNLIILPENKKALIRGLDGFSVVWTDEGLLIYPLDKEQEIKEDLKALE
jgi:mannose-1-phosphate guanylyltransferase